MIDVTSIAAYFKEETPIGRVVMSQFVWLHAVDASDFAQLSRSLSYPHPDGLTLSLNTRIKALSTVIQIKGHKLAFISRT